MQEIEAIKEDAYKRWISEDGLMRLDPAPLDDSPCYSGKLSDPRTVHNENGILFLAYWIALLSAAGGMTSQDADAVEAAVDRLQVGTNKGLYARAMHRFDRTQSHDNYVGIVALSVLCGTDHADLVVAYGERNGWCFNVVKPGEPHLGQTRQPGEVAFYKLAIGQTPAIWEFVHLVLGMCLNAFGKDVSTLRLTWLRFHTLATAFMNRAKRVPLLYQGPLILAWAFWALMLLIRNRGVFTQFRPDHPIARTLKLVSK